MTDHKSEEVRDLDSILADLAEDAHQSYRHGVPQPGIAACIREHARELDLYAERLSIEEDERAEASR